ncbi:type IV toxin-antitoxin system AbiEi family antitoxin domain-containing protein [Pseudonocardia phyllosphaerae]|uniref:type IV toxin-antitoxin system AbiEi family antitoxin domain-containing protein n=1 Tax=Pseudonocardia phyllosphaerae TaxID=3390502 RepID=UPI00397D5A06
MSLTEIVRTQAGLVSREQARSCGLSPHAVRRRVRAGVWSELRPGVYLVGGHRITDEVRVRAAALWGASSSCLVSGPAAAFWYGFTPGLAGPPEIVVPPDRSPRRQPGLTIRRSTLDAADRSRHRGLPTVGVARTVLDVAARPSGGSAFLDRALQRFVSFDEVYAAFCRMLGHPGAAEAGRLLVASAGRAHSAAERLLARRLRESGTDGWVAQYPFGPWHVDVAFPGQRVAVEVDGWAWHVDADRFQNDRSKGNALVAAGWHLLRFTWHDLDRAPGRVIGQVRAALAAATGLPDAS